VCVRAGATDSSFAFFLTGTLPSSSIALVLFVPVPRPVDSYIIDSSYGSTSSPVSAEPSIGIAWAIDDVAKEA
jgi:hypothetical protein